MNWYIGQEIVAIRNHSLGLFKNGDVFKIKSLRQSNCICGHILIDIGMSSNGGASYCKKCNSRNYYGANIWWFNEINFLPLDELADISELTEVLSEPVFNVKL